MGEKFDSILSLEDGARARLRGAVERRLTSVLFVLCLVCSTFLSIVETGVVNPLAPELWVGLANRFLTSYLTFIIFIAPGEQDELARDDKHKTVADKLDALSEAIYHGGLLSAFYEFCAHKEKVIYSKRLKSAYTRFMEDEEYEALADASLRALRKDKRAGIITKEKYKAIKKARKVHLRQIHPARVLSACAVDSTEEAGMAVISYAKRSIASKPITFMLMSLVLNSLTFTWGDTTIFDAIIGVITSAMIIFYSAYSGYKVGRNSAIWETSQKNHRIRFILEFEEWRKSPT